MLKTLLVLGIFIAFSVGVVCAQSAPTGAAKSSNQTSAPKATGRVSKSFKGTKALARKRRLKKAHDKGASAHQPSTPMVYPSPSDGTEKAVMAKAATPASLPTKAKKIQPTMEMIPSPNVEGSGLTEDTKIVPASSNPKPPPQH